MRQKILAPFVILFYCLILNKGILDGWAGWYYALQRMLAEILLSIHLIETERVHKSSNQGKAYSANYPSAITEEVREISEASLKGAISFVRFHLQIFSISTGKQLQKTPLLHIQPN